MRRSKMIFQTESGKDLIKTFLIVLILLFKVLQVHAQTFQPNFDESKVSDYTLPDVLRTSKNKSVKDSREWENIRRPEILKLFEDNIYGQMPKSFDNIRYSIAKEDTNAMNGKAHLKEVTIEVFNKGKSVKINVVLFVPRSAEKQVPVFILINNRSKDNTDPSRNIKSDFWPAEVVIESGYAIAAFHVGDLAPDDKEHFSEAALQLYPEQLTADNGMRAIGAWAWGACRVMDYFETDLLIDKKRVIVVGHSRGGKASLWAAAQDQRFAMCVTNCSGNTGAALSRRQFGERIVAINDAFPHWFTTNYKKYNNNENLLPVDQHMLISLIAPRAVYATNASEDLWADPTGTFLSLKHAEPVFALYGSKSKLPEDPPGIDKPVISSLIAYHNRKGEHNLTVYDWTNFIRFADYHFKATP
jgi:hypothetical protein